MPLDGARLRLISPAFPKAPPLSFPQTQRQQLFCCGLGQDGRAVAEGERSGGTQENAEDDPAAITQSHDREHAHVHRWRRDATTRRNGPIGPRRGDALGPPTLAHPPHCHIWTSPPSYPVLPTIHRRVHPRRSPLGTANIAAAPALLSSSYQHTPPTPPACLSWLHYSILYCQNEAERQYNSIDGGLLKDMDLQRPITIIFAMDFIWIHEWCPQRGTFEGLYHPIYGRQSVASGCQRVLSPSRSGYLISVWNTLN